MRLQISSAKWRPFCPGGDELIEFGRHRMYNNTRSTDHNAKSVKTSDNNNNNHHKNNNDHKKQ